MMKIFAFLFLTCLFFSCRHAVEMDGEHEDCMKVKMSVFKSSPEACSEGASIYTYQFQGERVYVFNPGNCVADFFSNVYDEDCNLVCSLGGIAGNITCKGDNFFNSATYETLIWKN